MAEDTKKKEPKGKEITDEDRINILKWFGLEKTGKEVKKMKPKINPKKPKPNE